MSPQSPVANALRPSIREFQAAYRASKAAKAAAIKPPAAGTGGVKPGPSTPNR